LSKLIGDIKEGRLNIKATKTVWLQTMDVATEIAPMLYRMPWTIVEAPTGIEFIISDSPIVKVRTDPKIPPLFSVGWLSPSAESTFPLNPNICLVIRPDGKEGRISGEEEWCHDVNRRTLSQAQRFVVSSHRNSRLDELVAAEVIRRTQGKK
jgi:hypothetical protein